MRGTPIRVSLRFPHWMRAAHDMDGDDGGCHVNIFSRCSKKKEVYLYIGVSHMDGGKFFHLILSY